MVEVGLISSQCNGMAFRITDTCIGAKTSILFILGMYVLVLGCLNGMATMAYNLNGSPSHRLLY